MDARNSDGAILTFADYQALAGRTANTALSADARIVTAALGFSGESGEVADLIKKYIGQGHDLDKAKLFNEIGDCLWYLAEMSTALGLSLSEIAQGNVEKLKARYPDGFDSDRSVNRAE